VIRTAQRRGRRAAGALLALLALLAAATPQPVAAEAPARPKIAVIDMQKIMRESEAVQSIQAQIDQQRTKYQARLSEKEKEIRAANEELMRKRSTLPSQTFQEKRRNLEEQVSQLQREIKNSKRQLDQNYSEAMRKVQEKLVSIVRRIAHQRELDMVLGKATVVIVRPELEITQQAITRLNDAMPSVDVPPLKQ
jgi:Skp family chaperone for outer membrane proteins